MFNTIKLNNGYWKKRFPKLKYGVPNPLDVFSNNNARFSEAMTTFGFSGVYKTTQSGRHMLTQQLLKACIDEFVAPVSVLDIGASDGSTSLDLINLINEQFKKYYVTDYNIKCSYISLNGNTYFFNIDNECFLAASEKFVFYPANKKLFNFLFSKALKKAQNLPKTDLLLINKDLLQKQQHNDAIEVLQHNIFEPWSKEKQDIVIVGNLLNRSYFTDVQIEAGIKNCYNALHSGGYLTIIRNTLTENGSEFERSTCYKKNDIDKVLEKKGEVNGGIEIDDLVSLLRF